jgi:hypothetical protein
LDKGVLGWQRLLTKAGEIIRFFNVNSISPAFLFPKMNTKLRGSQIFLRPCFPMPTISPTSRRMALYAPKT